MTADTRKLSVPMALGPHRVPGIWRHMLPPDLAFMRFPSECESTCDACPKVKEESFHPDVRCCSYQPRVPNFLLGLALKDPETAPRIRQMIADGLATPEGMQATPVQARASLEQAIAPLSSPPTVVCRFLDAENRLCGIYKYRDSVCATFFCKHDQKDDGYDFWRGLQSLAGQCEASLSQWLMAELKLDVAAYVERFDSLAARMPELLQRSVDAWPDDVLKLLWQQWAGKEEEFYVACADLAAERSADLDGVLDQWVIRSPWKYDTAFREALPPVLKEQMRKDGATQGDPVPIADLWYQFQLMHRNYWRPAE